MLKKLIVAITATVLFKKYVLPHLKKDDEAAGV